LVALRRLKHTSESKHIARSSCDITTNLTVSGWW
jgi:hypothetical protein